MSPPLLRTSRPGTSTSSSLHRSGGKRLLGRRLDGIRNHGGIHAPRFAARTRDSYFELVATADELRDRDILDVNPVSVRHRIDGSEAIAMAVELMD